MKVLELFSGSQSVGKVCEELGYEVVSVDITDYNGTITPTHKVDVMEFDYKQYEHFDIIWASPPCVSYSRLQQANYGRKLKRHNGEVFTKEHHELDMKQSDIIVNKTLEIINHFNPKLWFIENPATGKLIERDMMKHLPNYVVSYCMYSDWGYQKNTRIWTNKTDFIPKKCDKKCGNMIEGTNKHINNIGKVNRICRVPGLTMYLTRARIPPKLIRDLLLTIL